MNIYIFFYTTQCEDSTHITQYSSILRNLFTASVSISSWVFVFPQTSQTKGSTNFYFKNSGFQLGVVVHICNASTLGGSQAEGSQISKALNQIIED